MPTRSLISQSEFRTVFAASPPAASGLTAWRETETERHTQREPLSKRRGDIWVDILEVCEHGGTLIKLGLPRREMVCWMRVTAVVVDDYCGFVLGGGGWVVVYTGGWGGCVCVGGVMLPLLTHKNVCLC